MSQYQSIAAGIDAVLCLLPWIYSVILPHSMFVKAIVSTFWEGGLVLTAIINYLYFINLLLNVNIILV